MLILNQQLSTVWLNSDPQNGGLIRKILRGAMGIQVHQLYRNNIPRDMWDPTVSNSGSDQEDQLKRQRVMPDQQVVSKHPSSATLTDDCNMPKYRSKTHFNCLVPDLDDAEPLLELYSEVVCSRDGKPFKFYGSVVVTSGFYMECILNIDKSHPLDCPKPSISLIVHGLR